MKLTRIHFLAFSCGFVSLCLEMFWVRFLGFAWQGSPVAFGYVLSAFLLGIAFGAWHGKSYCLRSSNPAILLRQSSWWLILAGASAAFSPVVFAKLYFHPLELPAVFVLIGFNSFCLSVMFPIVHHLGVEDTGVSNRNKMISTMGKHFSGVYCCNVMGAALGPLLFGYVLLGFMTTQQALILISTLCFSLALLFFYFSTMDKRFIALAASVLGLALLVGTCVAPENWLLNAVNSKPQMPAIKIFETRQGIVTIHQQAQGGDMVMGGNIYDGTANLDLEVNSNGLNRPLLMTALHKKPRRVLMVGLSIGSWLALVREFPGVEHIDVVEINPGYLRAIENYPLQKAAIQDPRVKVHIQDARRWLKLNPDLRYDLIFMNTTYHWRNNITLLLSQEYLGILQAHMLSGAVLAFNGTGSIDALKTASVVFKYARRYSNFVYAADWDFTALPQHPGALAHYQSLTISGQPAFPSGTLVPEGFLSLPLVGIEHDVKIAGRKAEVITDYNMITEYRYGRR
jgi:spermidine synthase